ncbi:MAG: hypothetical protein E7580_00865, partial [Ruminococcaceae bacterium]|nr:hypothetical protein [Oscillospiraceae bacterium]
MSKKLLTQVVTKLVNEYATAKEYGVSLVTIPDFNYAQLAQELDNSRCVQLFFLGFSKQQEQELIDTLPDKGDSVSYAFTVEQAEQSRNSGDENVFRILIIKRSEIEKVSSLRWFPEITLEKVYTKSCDIVKEELSGTNSVIDALIKALRCKPVRSILSFERVLSYLELLLETEDKMLPSAIKENYYKLGLCADKSIDSKNPTKDDFVARIRRNHAIIEKIGNLEQTERQSITNYYSKDNVNKEMPRLILNYYKSRNIELLKLMDLDDVEKCLKAAKKSDPKPTPAKTKGSRVKPTALAAQLMFDNNSEQINDVLTNIASELDKDEVRKKAEKIDIDINDVKLQIHTEPITEVIATELSTEDDFGGTIRAEVQAPGEAIRDRGKYPPELFKKEHLDIVWSNLAKIATLLTDGETISESLKCFLSTREKLIPYRKRLQDSPMLQVLAKYSLFADYLKAYERLLNSINEDFPRIWGISASKAKEIINTVMSLDYVFIVGEARLHAIPTPLHPLYL